IVRPVGHDPGGVGVVAVGRGQELDDVAGVGVVREILRGLPGGHVVGEVGHWQRFSVGAEDVELVDGRDRGENQHRRVSFPLASEGRPGTSRAALTSFDRADVRPDDGSLRYSTTVVNGPAKYFLLDYQVGVATIMGRMLDGVRVTLARVGDD